MLTPKLVGKICRYDAQNSEEVLYQAEREVYIQGTMKQETIDTLTYSLKRVVTSGSAKSFADQRPDSGGQNGHCAQGNAKPSVSPGLTAWYQDMEEHRLTVVVTERPKIRSTAATPSPQSPTAKGFLIAPVFS